MAKKKSVKKCRKVKCGKRRLKCFTKKTGSRVYKTCRCGKKQLRYKSCLKKKSKSKKRPFIKMTRFFGGDRMVMPIDYYGTRNKRYGQPSYRCLKHVNP